MVNDISRAQMAYGAHALLTQPQQGNGHITKDSKISTPPGHGMITDKVDLSPAARQTLEEHHKARAEQQDKMVNEILGKGFRAWAQEKHREKIEAEVRAQVLSSMGLDEDDFATLDAEVQQRIQDIIEEKVREKMREEMEEDSKESGTGVRAEFLSL